MLHRIKRHIRKHTPSRRGIALRAVLSVAIALVIIFLLAVFAPVQEYKPDARLPATERDRAVLAAFNAVRSLENYQRNGGTNLTILFEQKLNCEGCYNLTVGFALRNHLDPDAYDSARANVIIIGGELADLQFSQDVS